MSTSTTSISANRRSQTYLALLFGLSLSYVFSCGSDARPNVLFLLADDMRPDAIRALGNPDIATPNLDKLVASGITFTRASCSYPICVVSRAEILTGRHGWENGVDGLRRGGFLPDQAFWPETFREAGYATWHIGKWHVSGRPSEFGYSHVSALFSGGGGRYWEEGQTDWKGFPVTGYRGWIFQSEDGRERFPELGVGVTPDISRQFADATIEMIRSRPDRPWMAHVNFTAPHDPLFLPPGYETRYDADEITLPSNYLPVHPFDHGNFDGRDEALLPWPRSEYDVRDLLRVYYAVISDLDEQVGRILAALSESGQSDRTLVVFSSDNGMACGSHGLRGKQNQYEHSINVPLILSGPGIPEGVASSAQVYLRDLFPTTCALAGIETPTSVTARSFASILRGGTEPVPDDSSFGYFTDTQRMIRSKDGWKLIWYPKVDRIQLFNLNEDPLELNDLANLDSKSVRLRIEMLQEELHRHLAETGCPMSSPDKFESR